MAGPGATTHIIIAGFMIDCSIGEVHTFDNEVTDFPVESGSNIVDNIRPLPLVVEIEGFVSNTPIGLIVNERGAINETTGVRDTKPVDDAYALFERIRDKREPVTIQTSLRTYDNMALERLSIPRGATIGDGLKFSASFKQIQYVTNKRTIRVSTPIAQGGTGKKKDKITAAPVPTDMRQITIDRKNKMWYDPDFSTWRFHCSYEEGLKVHDDTGSSVVTNISKWHLYRGAVQRVTTGSSIGTGQEVAKDDPFDMLRFTPPHPVREQILVTLNQCVLHGFVIKNAVPAGGSTLPRSLTRRRL